MNVSADPRRPREDILVSVCFAETEETADREPVLSILAQRLSAHIRYWEIILVVTSSVSSRVQIPNIPNVRIIKVAQQTDYFHRREIACSEAIGDVVLLSSFDELDVVDPVSMAETAWDSGQAIVAQRRGSAGALEHTLNALGRSSGLRASALVMQSMALPRPLVTLVMSYPDRQLALRFLPRDAGLPVQTWNCDGPQNMLGLGDFPRRLALMHSLLSHSASSVLKITSFMAAIASVGALFFLIYTLVAWVLGFTLAAGSLGFSVSIAGFVLFFGLALLGLTIGLRRVIDLISTDDRDYVVGETNTLELFADLSRELNVNIDDSLSRHEDSKVQHSE